MKTRCLLILLIMSLISVYAETAFDRITEKNAEYFIEASYTESTIRDNGISDTRRMIEKLFSKNAQKKWLAMVERYFSKEQIRDFFGGAVLLRGAVSERGGIGALYNPFWDTILIVESFTETETVNGNEEKIRKVNDFMFLNGAFFREEKNRAMEIFNTLANPPEKGLSYILTGLFDSTKKKFDSIYGKQKYPLLMADEDDNAEANISQIQYISALRLKMVSSLLGNKENYKEIWQLAKVLRKNSIKSFELLFSSEYAKFMSRYFVKLPENIRADFEPYAYYIDKSNSKIRYYVYVNTRFPRLFCSMLLGTGYGKTSFEWFDFAYSQEIHEAFQQVAKEAQK